MYSPGALNVAFVTVLPSASRSMDGLLLSNFTSPGPRNFVHVSAIGGGGVNPSGAAPRAAPRPAAPAAPAAGSPPRAPRPRPRLEGSWTLIFGPSSESHTVSGTGTPTVPVYFAAIVLGGPVKIWPFGSNLSLGGVFLFAASSNGSTM